MRMVLPGFARHVDRKSGIIQDIVQVFCFRLKRDMFHVK